MMTIEFVECSICIAKPGIPPLCDSCVQNRDSIETLKSRLNIQESGGDKMDSKEVEQPISDIDRILLSRMNINEHWVVISNPSYGYFEKACNMILNNECNQYAEYLNCGVYHRMIRMIRFKDLADYNINSDSILQEHILRVSGFEEVKDIKV